MLRKISILVLIFIFTLPLNVSALGVYDLSDNNEVEIVDNTVLDQVKDINKESYKYLIDNDSLLLRTSGILEEEYIAREDFLAMFFRLATGYRFGEVSESPYYIDVKLMDWHAGYVEWARYNGVARGYGNEVWGIGDSLTFEQMYKMVHGYIMYHQLDAYNILNDNLDLSSSSPWAKESILWCYTNDLIPENISNFKDPVQWETAIDFLVSSHKMFLFNKN